MFKHTGTDLCIPGKVDVSVAKGIKKFDGQRMSKYGIEYRPVWRNRC